MQRTVSRTFPSKCHVTRYFGDNTLTREEGCGVRLRADLKRVDAVGRGRVTRVVPGRRLDPAIASDGNGGSRLLAHIKNMHDLCFDTALTGST